MYSIVHNRIDNLKGLVGNSGAEKRFLKGCAGASEDMQTDVRERRRMEGMKQIIQSRPVVRQNCEHNERANR
jgi:hypothetical protein